VSVERDMLLCDNKIYQLLPHCFMDRMVVRSARQKGEYSMRSQQGEAAKHRRKDGVHRKQLVELVAALVHCGVVASGLGVKQPLLCRSRGEAKL
jgi:hypothetical protein